MLNITKNIGVKKKKKKKKKKKRARNSHECDGGPPGSFVACPLGLVFGKYHGDDHVTQDHSRGTGEQNGLSAQFIDVEDRWYGGDEHGDTHNTRSQQTRGVARCPQCFKNGRCIVEYRIDYRISKSALVNSSCLSTELRQFSRTCVLPFARRI